MILSALLHWIHNSTEKKVGSQGLKPLRAEFFGREELLRRAHEVAEAHTLLKPKRGRSRIRARMSVGTFGGWRSTPGAFGRVWAGAWARSVSP